MKKLKIISWNVNGLRAVHRKGIFLEWLKQDKPDILCIQETKANKDQLPLELTTIEGYYNYFSSAEKKGYSGVGLYTKIKPEDHEHGFGVKKFDTEGRIIIAKFEHFQLYNIYFPNGKASQERLNYKMDFYDTFLNHVDKQIKKGYNVVVCGDVNTAHKDIDLARPKENEKVSGFLPEERAWIDKFLNHGYTDTFRMFNKDPNNYTWWDYVTRARDRNVGWRIDYFFVNKEFNRNVKSSFILSNVMGSDHCPIGIEIKV